VYFWKDPERVLRQFANTLRAEGRLVIAFRRASDDLPARFRDEVYRFYKPEELEELARRGGFSKVRTERHAALDIHWLIAEQPTLHSSAD
jgi:hypothetical protein